MTNNVIGRRRLIDVGAKQQNSIGKIVPFLLHRFLDWILLLLLRQSPPERTRLTRQQNHLSDWTARAEDDNNLHPRKRRRKRQEITQRHRLELLHLLRPHPLRWTGRLPIRHRQTAPPRPQTPHRLLRRRPRHRVLVLLHEVHLRRLRFDRKWIYGQ